MKHNRVAPKMKHNRAKAAQLCFQGHALIGQDRSLVRLAGIEPTTLGFGGQYSIH